MRKSWDIALRTSIPVTLSGDEVAAALACLEGIIMDGKREDLSVLSTDAQYEARFILASTESAYEKIISAAEKVTGRSRLPAPWQE